MIYSATKRERR